MMGDARWEECYYAVDEILDNYEYYPWFMEAIRIRFEWDRYEM
jgi:hypothetical protein